MIGDALAETDGFEVEAVELGLLIFSVVFEGIFVLIAACDDALFMLFVWFCPEAFGLAGGLEVSPLPSCVLLLAAELFFSTVDEPWCVEASVETVLLFAALTVGGDSDFEEAPAELVGGLVLFGASEFTVFTPEAFGTELGGLAGFNSFEAGEVAEPAPDLTET